ncbi:MAG: hypothetical protein AAGF95_32195, partial [Chloroflexota bacterium]
MAGRRTRTTQFLALWCLFMSYLASTLVSAVPGTQNGDPNDPMTGTLVYETTVTVAPDEPIGRWFQEGTATEGGYLYRARIETNDAYVHVGYGTDASCQEMIDVAQNYLNDRAFTADKYLSVVPVDGTTGYFCFSYRKSSLSRGVTATIRLYRLNEIALSETIETDKLEVMGPIDESRISDNLFYEYTLEVTDVPFRISYRALRHYRREPDGTSVSDIVRMPKEQTIYPSITYIYNPETDSSERVFLNDSHLIREPGTYEIRVTHRGALSDEDTEGRDMGSGAIFAEIKGEPWAQIPTRCNGYEVEINSPEGPPISLPPGEVDARLYYTNDEEFDWWEVPPGPDDPILNVNIAGIVRTITYGEIGIGGPNHKTWRISSGGPDGQVTVTTPYPFHDGDAALLVICPPGAFEPDPTPTPTPDPQCQVYELDSQLSLIPISEGARLRSVSGVAIVIFNGNIEIPVSGMQWPHPTNFYNAYASMEVAELEVCGDPVNPSPSVTPITPLPSTTATVQLPPTLTPTTTQTPTPTATPTGTMLPTPTALPETPCEGEVWNIPVIPDVVRVRLDTGLKIAVLDATVYINVGESAQTLRPGSYNWSFASESYDVYSLTTPARLILCNLEPLPSPSAIASPPPTWTTDPDE